MYIHNLAVRLEKMSGGFHAIGNECSQECNAGLNLCEKVAEPSYNPHENNIR